MIIDRPSLSARPQICASCLGNAWTPPGVISTGAAGVISHQQISCQVSDVSLNAGFIFHHCPIVQRVRGTAGRLRDALGSRRWCPHLDLSINSHAFVEVR